MNMKKLLMLLMMVLPLGASAHTIPVPHSHHGVFHGWETTLIILLAVMVGGLSYLFFQKSKKRQKADR